MQHRSVNLIPFYDALTPNGKLDVIEIILNVLIFVPLGIYAGVMFKRWTWRKLLFLFLFLSISFMFEGLQFIFKIGAFDVTDLINNTMGGLFGLMVVEAIEKLFNNGGRAHLFINIVTASGTVIVISLLVLLKLNMLPIRYQ
jgi:glycopeptide antibiotics resistance protein